ncbi:hypothetical protein LY78DRAFT_658673 [Colletotrichum sublineola]|nr:hypothetical protein LY78DRAFT_658673 [Colletotrichum sublineola]
MLLKWHTHTYTHVAWYAEVDIVTVGFPRPGHSPSFYRRSLRRDQPAPATGFLNPVARRGRAVWGGFRGRIARTRRTQRFSRIRYRVCGTNTYQIRMPDFADSLIFHTPSPLVPPRSAHWMFLSWTGRMANGETRGRKSHCHRRTSKCGWLARTNRGDGRIKHVTTTVSRYARITHTEETRVLEDQKRVDIRF